MFLLTVSGLESVVFLGIQGREKNWAWTNTDFKQVFYGAAEGVSCDL